MISLSIMPFSGVGFWSLMILTVCLHTTLRFFSQRTIDRNILLVILNSLVVYSALGNHRLFILLLLLTMAVYLLGKSWAKDSLKSSSTFLFASLSLIVLILCYYKYAVVQKTVNELIHVVGSPLGIFRNTPKHIAFIGISYFGFKFIHYLVDCYKHKIKEPSLLTFINYALFFPGFFSGPINRYETFAADIREKGKPINRDDWITGLKRIINGLFKKTVLAANLFPYSLDAIDFTKATLTPLQGLFSVYAYMFYIYFDFSAYSDMAIGTGRLVGIHLPENFSYPFLKRNLQQFWANWHMSLTQWLTDYIYWPLAGKIRHMRKMKKRPVTTSNVCIIITFFVCGLWHGDGLNFIVWGLYHGVGLAILNMYVSLQKKYFPVQLRMFLKDSKAVYALSTFVTFHYVAFGFMLFALDLAKQKIFLNSML